jgi:DNA-binding MarR family transcriptional regulator
MTTSSPRPEDLADAFFTVAHGLKRTVNARFQHTGLSLARLRVLFQLIDRPCRMGELSTCVDVAPRTMTSTIEGMERDGLVVRQPDPADGRATIVSITDAGRRSYTEGVRLQARAVADLFDALDAEARTARDPRTAREDQRGRWRGAVPRLTIASHVAVTPTGGSGGRPRCRPGCGCGASWGARRRSSARSAPWPAGGRARRPPRGPCCCG